MKLSQLQQEIKTAIEKYGDMDVCIQLNRTEDCSKCGQPKDRNCSAEDIFAGPMGNGKGGYCFWVEGNVV